MIKIYLGRNGRRKIEEKFYIEKQFTVWETIKLVTGVKLVRCKMNRMVILGIDGLDYDLIIKWDLENLMQKEYGRITVPISEKIGVPKSPQVWASFLTGEYSKEMDLIARRRARGEKIVRILREIRRVLPLSLGLAKKISKPSKQISPSRFPKLNCKTFLDFPEVREVNAPFYSFDNKTFDLSFKYSQGDISIDEYVAELEKILLNKQRLVLRELERDRKSKVIFFYIHALDLLQHITFVKGQEFLRKYYEGLDLFLSKINQIEKGIIIVVSDHGFNFETGSHSMNGFYSSNEIIRPKPSDITDFYKIVEHFCKHGGSCMISNYKKNLE